MTIDNKNEIKYISFYGKGGKRTKQIDFKGQPHTHKGYMHNEHGTNALSPSEQKMFDRVIKIWNNHIHKQ